MKEQYKKSIGRINKYTTIEDTPDHKLEGKLEQKKKYKKQNKLKRKDTIFVLLLLMVAIIIVYVPSVKASLGTFKQGTCVDIKTISNTGSVTLSSLNYPNMTVAVSNRGMTQNGLTYDYLFCDTFTLGNYVYDYYDATNTVFVNDFTINPTGQEMTISKAVTYVLIFIVSFLIFIGLLITGIYLPVSNKKDEMTGYVIAVSNIKYVKMFCLALSYVTIIFISYFIYQVSYAYLDLDFLTNIFQLIFWGLTVLTLPLFILGAYFTIANAIRDAKIADSLSRGLTRIQ